MRKALRVLFLLAFVLGLLTIAATLYVGGRLTSNVERIEDVFVGLEHRPSRPTEGPAAEAVNVLLLGTDRRSDAPTSGKDAVAPVWVPGAQRADTMMLLHVDGDRRGASIVSIPRDAWVEIPGHGAAKANAAFSLGGPSLAVATVESLTGVHVDHLAIVDWDGFKELTDAAGGVTVDIPETVHDSARDITWTAGRHLLDGERALAYVGQRYGLPHGDLDRVRRQQAFLRALMEASLHADMRKDPRMLYDFLETVTRHVSVDAEWSTMEMARLVTSLRDLRTADLRYLTAPVSGLGREGAQSVVYLDEAAGVGLWGAVREDTLDDWAQQHQDVLTPEVVS